MLLTAVSTDCEAVSTISAEVRVAIAESAKSPRTATTLFVSCEAFATLCEISCVALACWSTEAAMADA